MLQSSKACYNMGTETNKDERNTPEYLAQLLKDKKQIQALPNVFVHAEKLLDEEINRVRVALFHHKGNRDPLDLPEPVGPVVTLTEKLFVPAKDHPDFNFVGRILGPRGMTAKELEQYTGCKIMVRGKGSMRDKKKEEANRGKANWEHLNEELHVLITVEDARKRAEIKMKKAVDEVKKLLVPAPDGEDDLKKRQLMELAIINGTYRDTTKPPTTAAPPPTSSHFSVANPWRGQDLNLTRSTAGHSESPRLIAPGALQMQHLRAQTPTGAPIILHQRMPAVATSTTGLLNGAPPPLVSPTESGFVYNPYEYPYAAFSPATILEYPTGLDQNAALAGAVPKMRRTLAGVRDHPYTRVTTLP
ncbi:protein quaking-A-like isoform X1 [Haliotis asinina]|uniref:protein quaking-A-like isoform X1 n=1 Tax=Haliotis asinina TaxID=109174 RepID=UPI00353182AE